MWTTESLRGEFLMVLLLCYAVLPHFLDQNGMFLVPVTAIPTPLSLVFLHSPVHPTRCQGGISCASPDRPHTHAHTEHIGKTKPLALPMKQSHFSMLSLSSIQSAVWWRHDSIVVASPHPKDGGFGGKRRRSWYIVDYFCLSSCWVVEMLAEHRENSR